MNDVPYNPKTAAAFKEALEPTAWQSLPEVVRLAVWIASVAVIAGAPLGLFYLGMLVLGL